MAQAVGSPSRIGSMLAGFFKSASSLLGNSQALSNTDSSVPKLQNNSISSISADVEEDVDEYGPDTSLDPFLDEKDPFEAEDDPFVDGEGGPEYRLDPRKRAIAADASLNSSQKRERYSRLAQNLLEADMRKAGASTPLPVRKRGRPRKSDVADAVAKRNAPAPASAPASTKKRKRTSDAAEAAANLDASPSKRQKVKPKSPEKPKKGSTGVLIQFEDVTVADDDGQHFASVAVNGTKFSVGDDCYVFLGNDRSLANAGIATILDIFKANKPTAEAGKNVALVRWYYRHQDIPADMQLKEKKGELFMSFHEDFAPIESLDPVNQPIVKHRDADAAHTRECAKADTTGKFFYSSLWDQRLMRIHNVTK
eukprot:TRINITY_DN4221_c0_g1_i1.p1 TRINITY_DN4221_c0_g1~~TRINITY_DN4221_c0_g1_i1.p1  ORF type:complete len:367 (+),score=82.60 TRINITY_DN4221_c0_g1_i1:947-2047(+)